MANDLDRRDFLAGLGVALGGAALGDLAVVGDAAAQDTPKGRIPETPVKFGHITIQSGPGAILGLPSLKGHTLAAEEINAAGGLLGKRKIETITADEAAGPEATVKEVKRMKLSEKIDYFSGVIAAHNQLAVGPVVEELKLLTIMTEGCIDKLFEVEVPNPHYLFGMTNILSADGVTTALAIAKAWPDVKRIAVINPDYAFGRWFQLHFDEAYQKRWNEYPSYAAEAAYTGLYLFKTAVEKANKQAGGGWPEDDAVIKQLEGLSIEGPAGLVTIRKEDHRAYKDVKVGFSKNLPDYPFAVRDPERIMTIPVGQMTAPPNWPKPGKGHNDPSATVNWIKTTWKKAGAS